jgi:hypothetical protein
MKRLTLSVLGGLVMVPVTACHTDPFSVKPEVNVALPDSEADSEGDQAEEPAEDTQS